MNIVVTNNDIDYKGFLKVSSLKEASNTVGRIDFLVYHNSDEDYSEKINYLSEIVGKVNSKLIYIREASEVDLAIKMVVMANQGYYFDDEFFLESSSELNNLIGGLDEVAALASLGGVNVLGDFFNRFLKNGSTNFTGNYLMVVKEAVNQLLTEYNNKNLEIIQMSETATDIFSNTSALIGSMKAEKETLQKTVEKISKSVQESTVKRSSSTVLYYPRIDYLVPKNIIRVKDIGNCTFLHSFMLGLRLYLSTVKNLRVKLIFIEPIGDYFELRYSEYPWVTVSSLNNKSVYFNDVVFTNCPNKDVLNTLLDDTKDVFIVVDRSLNDNKHILNSRGTVHYAVSSASVMKKFDIPNTNYFSSLVALPNSLFTIPLFTEYPLESSARERLYLSELSSAYEKLSLGVD